MIMFGSCQRLYVVWPVVIPYEVLVVRQFALRERLVAMSFLPNQCSVHDITATVSPWMTRPQYINITVMNM